MKRWSGFAVLHCDGFFGPLCDCCHPVSRNRCLVQAKLVLDARREGIPAFQLMLLRMSSCPTDNVSHVSSEGSVPEGGSHWLLVGLTTLGQTGPFHVIRVE